MQKKKIIIIISILLYSVSESNIYICSKQSWFSFYSNEIIKPHPLETLIHKLEKTFCQLLEYFQCFRRPLLVFCDLFYPTLSHLYTTSLGPDSEAKLLKNREQYLQMRFLHDFCVNGVHDRVTDPLITWMGSGLYGGTGGPLSTKVVWFC